MTDTPLFFKWLLPRGVPTHATHSASPFRWPLPTQAGPGDWTPLVETVEPCRSGYHACSALSLPAWKPSLSIPDWWATPQTLQYNPPLYLFEGSLAQPYRAHDAGSPWEKIAFAQARLVRQLGTPSVDTDYRLREGVGLLMDNPTSLRHCQGVQRQLGGLGLTTPEMRRLVLAIQEPDEDDWTVLVTADQFFTTK